MEDLSFKADPIQLVKASDIDSSQESWHYQVFECVLLDDSRMPGIEYFDLKEAIVQAREHNLVWDQQSLHLITEAIIATTIWTKAIANKELIVHLKLHSEEVVSALWLHWKN